ncbi:glycosyltransferase family 2 protein [Polynucleobacter sp. VK25]|uniref:glycosyltransferase family 2 protein n=1 Tax=Polynucleobacter sp. VK25 TaxID=1758398 RepID=UPI001BFDD0BE|nr:glycosyltransferase family 2 protein [Polynucleobacter sp. VK25]QWD68646.1 glycosyltransferase family 2 protein [Polynucleobacter sp. VK25]
MIAVSIVSHHHGEFLPALIVALDQFPEVEKIILTINVPDESYLPKSDKLQVIRNLSPKGFGDNHNSAFEECYSDFFCVLNPDIFFLENPFPLLLDIFLNQSVGVSAPLVCNQSLDIEDSFRNFPSLSSLFLKVFFDKKGQSNYQGDGEPFLSDWVAGMFMLFERKTFSILGGFDRKYYLYYEDVDICARVWSINRSVYVVPAAKVIHDARRQSHKNLKFFLWHLKSLTRYLVKNFNLPKRTQG